MRKRPSRPQRARNVSKAGSIANLIAAHGHAGDGDRGNDRAAVGLSRRAASVRIVDAVKTMAEAALVHAVTSQNTVSAAIATNARAALMSGGSQSDTSSRKVCGLPAGRLGASTSSAKP